MADLDPSAPLCPCGLRGCPTGADHRAAYVVELPLWRRRGFRRHKRRH